MAQPAGDEVWGSGALGDGGHGYGGAAGHGVNGNGANGHGANGNGVNGNGGATGARRGRPGYDQETLLAVCVDVFNEHGYDATSMGMLAEALGISKAAIYHHVKSKEELLSLSIDRALSRLDRVVEEARATEGPARTRLEVLIRGSVQALVDERPHVTLLLRLRGNSPMEVAALNHRRALTKELEARVEYAQQEGAVRDDVSSRHLARLIFGMVNSMVDWFRPDRDDAAAVADAVLAILFEGIMLRGAVEARGK